MQMSGTIDLDSPISVRWYWRARKTSAMTSKVRCSENAGMTTSDWFSCLKALESISHTLSSRRRPDLLSLLLGPLP